MSTKRKHLLCTCVLLVALISGVLPAEAGPIATSTSVEPKIALLNPSSFASAGSRGIVVSDLEPDGGPNCCEAASAAYRLSAWVANAPSGSSVFFLVTQSPLEFEVVPTKTSKNNTWMAEWDMPPEVVDGPATVGAYLVLEEEVLASTEVDVTIMKFQETTQITYPNVGGSLGTFAPLANTLPAEPPAARKAPLGIVDSLYSDTAKITYVRTFYTTSAPGEKPEWKVCATETITAASNGNRCALEDQADQGAVTAIATVANDSPDSYDSNFNQSGDAVPVGNVYTQVPTQLSLTGVTPEAIGKAPDSDRFFCSGNQTVTLTDQFGRAIPGANIDVHATGPSDGVRFHTFAVLAVNQPPNRGSGHTTESGFDCTGQSATLPPSNANPSTQGEHQRFGAPDRKHIEVRAGGTSDLGAFSFRLHSNQAGAVDYTAWVDESDDGCAVDDDLFTFDEIHVSGSLGFGQPALPAQMQPFETPVSCPDGEPLPEPSPPGPEPPAPSGDRSVDLRTGSRTVSRGESFTLRGRIDAVEADCAAVENVKLKKRKPKGRFHTVDETLTDANGRYTFKTKVRNTSHFRAVVIARGFCAKAKSNIVKVRAG